VVIDGDRIPAFNQVFTSQAAVDVSIYWKIRVACHSMLVRTAAPQLSCPGQWQYGCGSGK
jgi:hypothetical protein